MSTPQAKQSSAPAADNEVELQSLPMDLAHKSNPTITSGSTTAVPTRVETAKPIFLVGFILFTFTLAVQFMMSSCGHGFCQMRENEKSALWHC